MLTRRDMNDRNSKTGDGAEAPGVIDRPRVEEYLARLHELRFEVDGRVAYLVETPESGHHVTREQVQVVSGKGFAGDHERKSYYRGRYVPGREVSAVSLEVLQVLEVDPVVVGDNLITEGIDLGALRPGDRLHVGEVVLERSAREHRPCTVFRDRTTPEAFAAIGRRRYRGALFVVRKGGRMRVGDRIVSVGTQ